MSLVSRQSSSLPPLAVVLAAVGVLFFFRARPDAEPAPTPTTSADVSSCSAEDGECPALGSPEPGATSSILAESEACGNVGYLCTELDATGSQRLFRWPSETERISVRVPLPEHEPPVRARRLRRAAILGLSAWQGHPFPLDFLDRLDEGPADVVIRWTAQLGGSSLGSTRTRWIMEGESQSFVVVDFSLATRSPYDERVELQPSQVELTAAHEMGHALGLPHSDDPRDVMYPKNTAVALTSRDYRTLEALYALPNGAEIER